MAALKLLAKLALYYAVLAAVLLGVMSFVPDWRDYLPIGGAQALIADTAAPRPGDPFAVPARTAPLAPSLLWLLVAVVGALAVSLPVSRVYMDIRNPHDYDQSLVDTIVVLPMVVTGIVVVVQNSLALAFSLAGIAGAVRFRNSLKSSGDLLFILLAIGIGLATGIGAMELAIVITVVFNLCFVALWATSYGERAEGKRFLNDFDQEDAEPGVVTTTSTVVAAEVTERLVKRPSAEKEDDDD